jgi:hypothetical protein
VFYTPVLEYAVVVEGNSSRPYENSKNVSIEIHSSYFILPSQLRMSVEFFQIRGMNKTKKKN